MKKISITMHTVVSYALPLLAVLVFGFHIPGAAAGMHLGKEIPKDLPVTSLAVVVEKPADYDGKTIVLKGIVSSICASRCHFIFQDGVQTVAVYPRGFKLPKMKRGSAVTVYTEVIAGQGQTVFSALGLEM
jgi:hypothetical protein